MLNKLSAFIREQRLLEPGDRVTCAVSGGADSIALLFGLYLLKDKLQIQLEAAHFNHKLRGEESDRDEAFVRSFCDRYEIPLTVGSGTIRPGKKGLEAAAREGRYAFLRSLPGKIATAHTADDNAETVLMHLLRGTGLKGLGGIAPVNGSIVRPMLTITRADVEDFLQEYFLPHAEDSSNAGDAFLRNRIRHSVMPLMKGENPSFSTGVSALALRLRQEEDFLSSLLEPGIPEVPVLRTLHPALRSRYLERFLKESGVREPEQSHIAEAEKLVFSPKPSARASFPGGVTVVRAYNRLVTCTQEPERNPVILPSMGEVTLPEWGIRVRIANAEKLIDDENTFAVNPCGPITLRSRETGDSMRFHGGTKSIKKAMIDRKIPAYLRGTLPVLVDSEGVLAVSGLGVNQDRAAKELPAIMVSIQKI